MAPRKPRQSRQKHFHLEFPENLANQAIAALNLRGVSVQDAFTLYLTAIVNGHAKNQALKLVDVMPFGKFRGASVETVIRGEPEYIAWLLGNSETFHLDIDAITLHALVMESTDPDSIGADRG